MPSLIDEIDRLFDEMVRTRWRRTTGALGAAARGAAASFEVEVPLTGGEHGDVLVGVESGQLIVAWRRRFPLQGAGDSPTEPERIKRAFLLPENAEVGAIEARFEGDVLRVRVGLRPRRR